MRICDVCRLLESREISCTELTRAYLGAAEKRNPDLLAFTMITADAALETAAAVDQKLHGGGKLSPLEGVPFVLKDNIATKGIRTTCASKMLADHVPVYDAFVWDRLKSAGAVMIGKGNMDEFAMGSTGETSYFGCPKNPVNTAHVAGGSSGGVAAAVAGGLAVFGVGSDTGGSIRQPASFCGAVGLKPTYGAVSRRGLIAYASSLDQIGPAATCVEDAALVFDALCQKDALDMTSRGSEPVSGALDDNIAGLRIGIADEFFDGLRPDIAEAVNSAAEILQSRGAELVHVDFPMLTSSLPAYYILACAEASSNLGRYDGLRYGYRTEHFTSLDDFIRRTRSEGFGPEVRRRILLGTYVLSAGYYDAYYNRAQRLRQAICAEFSEIFAKCDCLLTPTVPVTALKYGLALSPVEVYRTDLCTVPANIAGIPAVSVPCGFDAEGLPIGLQLMGPRHGERVILSAALAFERETSSFFLKEKGSKRTL